MSVILFWEQFSFCRFTAYSIPCKEVISKLEQSISTISAISDIDISPSPFLSKYLHKYVLKRKSWMSTIVYSADWTIVSSTSLCASVLTRVIFPTLRLPLVFSDIFKETVLLCKALVSTKEIQSVISGILTE